jgi:ubiquinone/menaquinone biosynthesis C-methylase UbiE
MDVQAGYTLWAPYYDSNQNRTRDLEGQVLREVLGYALGEAALGRCLEIGCGTGKNTVWLAQHAVVLTSVDVSSAMLAQARSKVSAAHVHFLLADIREPWVFASEAVDLITCSLVLEHIADLGSLFAKAAKLLAPNGRLYLSELHPFKKHLGSRPRFTTDEGRLEVESYGHSVSGYIHAALDAGLRLDVIREDFHSTDDVESSPPRLLTLVLSKP